MFLSWKIIFTMNKFFFQKRRKHTKSTTHKSSEEGYSKIGSIICPHLFYLRPLSLGNKNILFHKFPPSGVFKVTKTQRKPGIYPCGLGCSANTSDMVTSRPLGQKYGLGIKKNHHPCKGGTLGSMWIALIKEHNCSLKATRES